MTKEREIGMLQNNPEKDSDLLIGISDRIIEAAEFFPDLGFVTRFFREFSFGTVERGLSRVQLAGWKFKKASAQRMAVLAFKDDRAVFKHRNDHGSARMMEILSGRDHTVRRFNGIFVHLKEGSFVGDSAVNQFLS